MSSTILKVYSHLRYIRRELSKTLRSYLKCIQFEILPVADPGFPRGGGANSPRGAANIRFCQKFPKTAWNWKNFGPRGGGASKILLCRSATDFFPGTKQIIRLKFFFLWEIQFVNDASGLRACLHVPSPWPSTCPCPSNLHCVNGDGLFDGEKGFCTQSAHQMVYFHWHNIKLWLWWRWRQWRYV